VSGHASNAFACGVTRSARERVRLGHGSGGRLTHELIESIFVPAFRCPELEELGDAALLDVEGVRIAFTTDAFVVQPHVFPGADIGTLAVNGTVNDLSMVGAVPSWISAAFVLEEGFELSCLDSIVRSMAVAADLAGVRVVTGDTKVVERGSGDGVFIVTSGIGRVPDGRRVGAHLAQAGDAVIVSGPVGAHGVAVMSRRAGISFDTDVISDTVALTGLVEAMFAAGPIHCLRDATRGGLATTLNELAAASAVRITIDEIVVPVDRPVRAACELLGLDPLYVANEGVCVAVVPPAAANAVVAAMHKRSEGRHARVVGVVEAGAAGVRVRTGLGVTRPLLMLSGDQLPRIC
jgi:hydrogenase expression/formation protein HypE